jgi:release factor glutamine methyltransferase
MHLENTTILNKSFARRIGKKLSIKKKYLIEKELPKYQFDAENINTYSKVFLEIGFGMGHHFIAQFLNNPDKLYIGAEPYLNGVGDVLDVIVTQDVRNVRIIPDSVDLVLPKINPETISCIYLLFPDPWSKRRQNKNRIISKARCKLLFNILKKNALLIFASDINYYVKEAVPILEEVGFTLIKAEEPHESYVITKYHQKAIEEGRAVRFLHFQKKCL